MECNYTELHFHSFLGLGERDTLLGLPWSAAGDFLAGDGDLVAEVRTATTGERRGEGDRERLGEGERRRGEGERLRGDGERPPLRGEGERPPPRGEGERYLRGLLLPLGLPRGLL